MMKGVFHGAVGKARDTAMVDTPLKFIDGSCVGVVPVYHKMIWIHVLFFVHLCFLHAQFEAGGLFWTVFLLPIGAILGQHEIGCEF